jgi:hypothetical protein
MKRTKNSRKMHMVFNVQTGTVEVKVHENEFTVHRGGIWQVPRGKSQHFSSITLSGQDIELLHPRNLPPRQEQHVPLPAPLCPSYDSGHIMLDTGGDIACSARILCTASRARILQHYTASSVRGKRSEDYCVPSCADCGVVQDTACMLCNA